VDKGTNIIVQLAKELPKITFVVAGFTPIQEHVSALMEMKKEARLLENIIFVELPLNYKHHYYERELYRNAKAFMAPFDSKNYWEGFGLSNACAVACRCPLIISDSESTRELWIEGKDCLIGDSYKSFKYLVEYFDNIGTGLKPENKFSIENYGKEYEKLAVMANMAV
jgi:glycosyltransferase involved in cell wall biosynthesis